MAIKMAEWPSGREPISKIMLPDGVKGDIAPWALELWYDFHKVECHLGNVGLSLLHGLRYQTGMVTQAPAGQLA